VLSFTSGYRGVGVGIEAFAGLLAGPAHPSGFLAVAIG